MATEGQGTKPLSHQDPGPRCSLLLGLTAPCISGMQAASPGSSDPGDGDRDAEAVPAQPCQAGLRGGRPGVTPHLAPEQHEGCLTCRQDKRTPKMRTKPQAELLPEETQIPSIGGVIP